MSRHREFHARALAEAKRYGQDSLVFLRELAQNARDAGASRIEVTTGVDRDHEWVTFDDDGKGMTFDHARSYLFRLYASSKEGDPEAAGCFGVGFWSVLRWEPATVTVESATRRDSWALSLDAGLDDVREATCVKHSRGTRVTLTRRRQADTAAQHSAAIADGLRRYCRYIRRAGVGFVALPIRCDGAEINEPFAVPGPVSLSFASYDAEGVVGLGEEPRVELYARGLLVMTVAVLDELEPGKIVAAKSRHVGGLAPVVLINSNRLEVVLSRQAPLSSRVLRRLVRLARSRVRRLVNHVVDGACPQPWWERLRDRVRTVWDGSGLKHAVRAAALVATVAAGVGLVTFGVHEGLRSGKKHARPRRVVVEVERTPGETEVVAEVDALAVDGAAPGGRNITVEVERTPGQPPPARIVVPTNLPYSNLDGYQGATVEVPDETVMPWGLAYDPPDDVFFRAHTLDRYDPRRGWLRGEAEATANYPEYRCRRHCIRVRLLVTGSSEPLIVPVPTGHRLASASLQFASEPVTGVRTNRYGEAVVSLAAGVGGVLEYVTGPYVRDTRPTVAAPDVELPPWLEKKLARIARLPPRRRVQRITKLVRERIAYDVSPESARAFSESDDDWVNRVLSLSAGDCDVKNGLNVLLLRRVGIPARMAVGIAGSRGRARPHLHAWTEYFIKGWGFTDATGTARPRRGAPVAAATAPSAPPVVASLPLPRAPAGPAVLGTIQRPARLDQRWVWGLGSIAVALLVAGVLVRRRVSERVSARGDTVAQQRALARILRDALSHPDSWRTVASLWHRRVLPTLAGAPLSMADAIRRAADGTLFVSWQRSELARVAARHGTAVLDGRDPVFGEVIGTLGAGMSLDAYDRLRPVDPAAEDVEAIRLDAALAPVNALLKRIGDHVECRVCPDLSDGPLRDVDLTGVRLPRAAPWPRRYIAVNPADREVRRRLELMAAQPAHGAFLWLDWLIDHSELLAGHAARLRERAAADALEELV